MNKKTKTILAAAIALVLVCAAAAGGFAAGKAAQRKQSLQAQEALLEQRELLRALNRSSMEKLNLADGTIWVIGHRSPDSDTVCSAVAYARFLTLLGYDAAAAITEPVNNETAFILRSAGASVPPVLEDAAGKNIFLVDHSEYAQAAEGMEDAHIVGILDHHGVGSVKTGQQVAYEAKPIGATATVVWLDYLNCGFEIDSQTAYLLLGAVLSDTDGLTGSTVTEADRKAAEALAALAGVEDTAALYRELHVQKLSYEGMTDAEILFSDYKEYEAGGVTFGIGLQNAIDEDAAKALAERMKQALPEGYKTRDVELMYASVGIRENGEKIDYIVPCDEHAKEVFEEAFPDYDEYDGTAFIFRTGLGRKTKFVPGLTDFLEAHPHE